MRAYMIVVASLAAGCGEVKAPATDARPADGSPPLIDAPIDAAVTCGPEFNIVNGTRRYYRSPNIDETWAMARTSCQARGGYLAIPDDFAELQFMSTMIGDIRWLGIHDPERDGTWITVRGVPFPSINPLWAPGYPMATHSIGKIVSSDQRVYSDDNTTADAGYICECP
jgi:Lectin C-type domain